MKRTNKIIIAVALVAVLLISIGYAAIQNITLNIAGTGTADPSQANFTVKFTGTPEVSDEDKVTAAITDDLNATIKVEGLTAKGDIVTATYTVQNTSADLSADLSVETTNSNEEYFLIGAELAKTSIIAGEATTLTVTVELIKTPITAQETSTIGVQLTAAPVQPGEEGISGGSTGSTETTLASITNENIGDYIDLGNNIVGTEATTDDWRVLLTAPEEGVVVAILADYLPNSTGYAANAGLDTSGTYVVYSETDRDTLLNGLTNSSNWQGLANGIATADVLGSAYLDYIIDSYNIKNGTDLNYATTVLFDISTEDYDLYFPRTNVVDNCYGYWLSEAKGGSSYEVFSIFVEFPDELDIGFPGPTTAVDDFNHTYLGIRPIITIYGDVNVTRDGDIWTITQ